MKTRWTQQREQGGSSITSLKNKLPSDAAETNSQAANRIFQCRLGEEFVSFIGEDLTRNESNSSDGAVQPRSAPQTDLVARICTLARKHRRSREVRNECRNPRLNVSLRFTGPLVCAIHVYIASV